MDVYLVCILVFTLFCKNIPVASGLKVEIVRYKVSRNNPTTRRCAVEIMHNQKYVGGRVSKLTGACEKLKISINKTPTMDPGYEYIEKLQFQKDFQPPTGTNIDPAANDYIHIPGPPFTSGSRLEVTFYRTPPLVYGFWVTSGDTVQSTSELFAKIDIWVDEIMAKIMIRDSVGLRREIPFIWRKFCPLDNCKISMVIKDEKVELHANDKRIENSTTTTSSALLSRIERVGISLHERSGRTAQISSLEYTK